MWCSYEIECSYKSIGAIFELVFLDAVSDVETQKNTKNSYNEKWDFMYDCQPEMIWHLPPTTCILPCLLYLCRQPDLTWLTGNEYKILEKISI